MILLFTTNKKKSFDKESAILAFSGSALYSGDVSLILIESAARA